MARQDSRGNWQGNPGSADVESVVVDPDPGGGAGGVAQQIYESHGFPTGLVPDDPTLPAQCNDLDSGGQWIWSTESQTWS